MNWGKEYKLTPREFDIADLVSKGFCNKKISRQLSIKEHTVKVHVTNIFRKTHDTNRVQLALRVHGLLKDYKL